MLNKIKLVLKQLERINSNKNPPLNRKGYENIRKETWIKVHELLELIGE